MRSFVVTSEDTLAEKRTMRSPGRVTYKETVLEAYNPLDALNKSVDPGGLLGEGPHAMRRVVSIIERLELERVTDDELDEILGITSETDPWVWDGVRAFPWEVEKLVPIVATLSQLVPGLELVEVESAHREPGLRQGSPELFLRLGGRFVHVESSAFESVFITSNDDCDRARGIYRKFEDLAEQLI